MRRAFALALATIGVLAGCGSSAVRSDASATRLQLVVDEAPVEVAAGDKLVVQLLIVGPRSEEATITSSQLPSFATLDGRTLTVRPGRKDVGTYSVSLTATTPSDSTSALVALSVTAPNAPPRFGAGGYIYMHDGQESRFQVCPGSHCTIRDVPALMPLILDDDGDEVTFEVEIVPEGQEFSGAVTYACAGRAWCALQGLTPGESYQFAVRARDALGAYNPEGWLRQPYWRFQQGPCPPGVACACVPSGYACGTDVDCCAGRCSTSAAGPLTCL